MDGHSQHLGSAYGPTPLSLAHASLHLEANHSLISTMKNYVRFLLALAQRAPVSDNPTDALSTRAVHDIGCYALDTTYPQTLTFNTPSACSQECEEQGHTVFAVRGQSCMCLDSMPSDDMKADASTCDVQCPGFPTEKCELLWSQLDASLHNSNNQVLTQSVTQAAERSVDTTP